MRLYYEEGKTEDYDVKKILAVFLAVVFIMSSAVFADEEDSNDYDYIVDEEAVVASDIIGAPHYDMEEGSYGGTYWQTKIMGSGAICWMKIECAYAVSRLDTSLKVSESPYFYYIDAFATVNRSSRNSDNCGSIWDNPNAIARSAWGSASMNGTNVSTLLVFGWW